jgi:hypothetical protein
MGTLLLLWVGCMGSRGPVTSDLELEPTVPAPWIPAQCYASTDGAHNPCWTCHQQPLAPNFVDDSALQVEASMPAPAARNPWTHTLRTPPPAIPEAEVLAWVRTDNYRDEDGGISLARTLPASWAGYVPDAHLSADEQGWDRSPSGERTGWRAYSYWPLPGSFWPTNGSWGDAWLRLPAIYRHSEEVYRLNLALLEAVVRRADVPLATPADETLHGDLDRDGVLGQAHFVSIRGWDPRKGQLLRWVGEAGRLQDRGELQPPTPGLFPEGTEILHSVRYLDPVISHVRMAPRMKELRYAVKTRWQTYADLELAAASEAREEEQDPDVLDPPQGDLQRGVFTGTGWRLQGFIEDSLGELRPQTVEETRFCVGCHGGVGANVDSMFSFARKVPGESGWRADPTAAYALPDRRRADGRGEAALYLQTTGSGDDFAQNDELRARFFDAQGQLDPAAAAILATDLRPLLLPSPERALKLDAGYMALVKEQSFTRGRGEAFGLSEDQIHRQIPEDHRTGVEAPVLPEWVR